MPPASAVDVLPPSRLVRWLFIAGVILVSVGLYFRYGLNVPPIGSSPTAETPTSPDATR